MDGNMPGFPVLHCLPEFAQTHVHWVGDAIQSSHSLSSPSPPHFQSFPASRSFPVSQFFLSGGQSIRTSVSASIFPVNIQDWLPLQLGRASVSIFPMNIQGWFPSGLIGLIFCCPKDSWESSWAPQFKSINSLAPLRDFLVAQTVKHLPAMWETRVWSPGQEDPLEKEMATPQVFLPGKSHG